MKIKPNTRYYQTRAAAQARADEIGADTYYLSQGEYERPDWKARKAQGKDKYYVYIRYYYEGGAFYTRKSGAETVDDTPWI